MRGGEVARRCESGVSAGGTPTWGGLLTKPKSCEGAAWGMVSACV